jgi:hypothetical protein
MNINPMQAAPRCTAKSKRTGQRCRAPAVKGWKVCRMHGARGGAPEGEKNGNYKHGARTKEMIALRKLFKNPTLIEDWAQQPLGLVNRREVLR